MDNQIKRRYLMNWMAKLHKLHRQQASTFFLVSWVCFSTCCIKSTQCQTTKPSACLHFRHNYSVVEFVMTLAWFIRCHSFTFPLSQRGFVPFFCSDIFLNPDIDPRQESENKFLWQVDKQLKYCLDSKKGNPVWVSPFCFLALNSVLLSEALMAWPLAKRIAKMHGRGRYRQDTDTKKW